MKSKPKKLSPNPAAKALREAEFRQRVVKSKKHATYTRKEKHKKREGQQDDLPFFYGVYLACQCVYLLSLQRESVSLNLYPGLPPLWGGKKQAGAGDDIVAVLSIVITRLVRVIQFSAFAVNETLMRRRRGALDHPDKPCDDEGG